jgi:hypothetical protein
MSSALPDATCTASFRVTLVADLGAAMRIINLFAQQGLLPDRIAVATHPGRLVVSVRQSGIAAGRADLIAARMQAQVDVARVVLKKLPANG